jgi:hypothetical protein
VLAEYLVGQQFIAHIVDALTAVYGGYVKFFHLAHHSTAKVICACTGSSQHQLGHADTSAFVAYAFVTATVNNYIEIIGMF